MIPFKEFSWIDSMPLGKAQSDLLQGIGDDAAVFSKEQWAISTDSLVQGVHFLKDDPLRAIGRKCAAVNLSDMAAMACKPEFFLFNLHRPQGFSEEDSLSLRSGLMEMLDRYQVQLIGGDTVSSHSDELSIVGTIFGRPFSKAPVYRSGAQVGDRICVTGKGLGASFPAHHLAFEPRVEWSRELVKHCRIHSMIDLSDGLAQDIRHILKKSSCGAHLDLWKIPLSESICKDEDALTRALSDGEDFELLFTLADEELERIPKGVEYHEIGKITGHTNELVGRMSENDNWKILELKGYCHDES